MSEGSDPEAIGDGYATRETAKAICVLLDDGKEFWIPKSVLHDDSDVWHQGQKGLVVVKRWWAEKEGLG